MDVVAVARTQASRAFGASGKVAVAVAAAHGLNDAYTSFLHPLLPRIMQRMDLSIALAAVLTTTLSLASSLLQPVMGHLADRFDRRAFVVLGPLSSAVFLSMIGLAPGFAVLLVLLVLGGLGSAAFHPPGAAMAVRVGEGAGSGARLSLFSFGGAAGYAVGPLIAVGLVSAFGLERLWIAMIPALVVMPVLFTRLPRGGREGAAAPPAPLDVIGLLAGPLGLLFAISAISTFVQRVFQTMQPIATAAAGGSEALGALALSVYLSGQAAGSLLGGFLTDRIDRRGLMVALTLVSLPTHLLAIALPPGSPGALVSAAAAGCVTMALLAPIVITAHELLPHGTGVGSGIVMGLAWAAGSIGVLGAGALGDLVGARAAALISTPTILIATGIAMHPALRRGFVRTAPVDAGISSG
jgi:FSR family fosmidomycin resistance protein-like MFS transporter